MKEGVNMIPGLYNKDGTLKTSWEKLKSNKEIIITNGILENADCLVGHKLVLSNEVKSIMGVLWNIENLYINKNCEEISITAIGFKTKIKNIEVDLENPYYSSEDGILFNKDKTKLIRYPKKTDEKYIVPESVTEIEEGAFCSNQYIKEIKLSKNISTIGPSAFATTAIEKINIPENVKEVATCTFYACKSLKNIKIPNNIQIIGERAFQNCDKLESVHLGKNIKIIDESIFDNCYSLNKIYYYDTEEKLTNINNWINIFSNNSLSDSSIIFTKDLKTLLDEGKSIHDANKILKKYEKDR